MLKKIIMSLLVLSTFISMKATAEDYGACYLHYKNGMYLCVDSTYKYCEKLWEERKNVLTKNNPGFFSPKQSCPKITN